MKLKTLLLTLFLSTSLINITYADFNDARVFNQGIKAYNDGDYKTAFRKWKTLTPNEDYVTFDFSLDTAIKVPGIEARAEYEIGSLYEKGLGVLKVYTKAYEHYRRSAKWNYPQAQLAFAKLSIKIIEDGLVEGLTEEKRLEGYKEVAEFLSKLYENERATDEMREEAEELWNQYELHKYFF